MNKIYSLVWNRVHGQVEVASEIARHRGGAGRMGAGVVRWGMAPVAFCVALIFGSVTPVA